MYWKLCWRVKNISVHERKWKVRTKGDWGRVKATYYSVKEWMLEAIADGDSLLGIDYETLANQIFGILWYVRPLWRHEAVFSLHDVSQHDHLFTVPEGRAADKECEHNDTAGPAKRDASVKPWCEPRFESTHMSTSFEYPAASSNMLHLSVSGAR